MAKLRKLSPGDAAPDGRAFNANDQEVTLSSFWREGPILLTFLRHFG